MSTDKNPTRPNVAKSKEARREGEMRGQLAQVNSLAWPCCLSCEHFKEAQEICELYEERPPAKVIVIGCPSYNADIPF